MSTFIWSQLRFRRNRSASLAAAIFVAAIGFVLLTASASDSELRVHGTLTSTFRPAYDILVRPPGSRAELEQRERLVRPNFLSGIYGGISFAQWRKIERISGVSVAAPISNIGFEDPLVTLPIPLGKVTTGEPQQLYRVDATWVADDGLSRYPASESYVYYAPRDRFVQPTTGGAFLERGSGAAPLPTCSGSGFVQTSAAPTSPFPSPASRVYLECFPSATNRLGMSVDGGWVPSSTFVGTVVQASVPIYLSAIDPVQEARLVGLDHTVVSGRYLKPHEGLRRGVNGSSLLVPVLASTRSYVGEHLQLSIRRLKAPAGSSLARALATGACREGPPCAKPIPPPAGATYRSASQFVQSLGGPVIATRSIPFGSFYHDILTAANPGWPEGTLFSVGYWATGPTRYSQLGPDHLSPRQVRNSPQIWRSQFSGYYFPPRDNLDVQFRPLHERVETNVFAKGVAQFHPLEVVGRFDPAKLPGFSALTRVPLETYFPPSLSPGDAAAARALRGEPLKPSQNLGGYVQSPPLLLTTMQALETFLEPKDWSTGYTAQQSLSNGKNRSAIPETQRLAPISAIRVRVAGVKGPDPLSLERIKVVAQKIHVDTGLAVDITDGSSPHPVAISLPKGEFGRPALLLTEGWSKKGVTVSFLRALDRKDLGLFGLILIICAFFLGNGALASVRSRRAEIGTLLTLGWPRRAIFTAVLGELLLIGGLAGLAGAALSAALVSVFSLALPLWRVLLVVPIAVALALVAGALPAWQAARGLPLDALRAPVKARARRRRVRRLGALALVNLTRLPARTIVGASGLTIGVAALGVLVGIERAFQGTLVGTLLGNAVSVQVRGADFGAVGLTIALAALSVADVVYLNLRERQAELVTLRTLGWSGGHIRRIVLLESLGLGLLGSLSGGVLALLVGRLVLSVPLGPLAVASLIAGAGGVVAAVLASIVPLSQIGRLTVPAVLAAE